MTNTALTLATATTEQMAIEAEITLAQRSLVLDAVKALREYFSDQEPAFLAELKETCDADDVLTKREKKYTKPPLDAIKLILTSLEPETWARRKTIGAGKNEQPRGETETERLERHAGKLLSGNSDNDEGELKVSQGPSSDVSRRPNASTKIHTALSSGSDNCFSDHVLDIQPEEQDWDEEHAIHPMDGSGGWDT